jgi:HlyD family secretion protein
MRRRLARWAVVTLLVGASAGGVYYWQGRAQTPPTVSTSPVTRGDIVATVEATGTLQAVTTVLVGTQVSGTIKRLYADFNDHVRRGQIVAELDPSLFQTQVDQARASIVRLEADARRAVVQSEDAQLKLRRARELAARALIPASDLETAETTARLAAAAVDSANAQIVQARASLNQNAVNLEHTIIRAPIDGVVISRNVDVGQTVAASMQAPTLFVIAQDLAKMQVNASVAEADIGRITPGLAVSFRVDAYPGETFTGVVSRVRLDPVVQQNVVSYVTAIDVPNPDLRLKPGMTANVTIEVERAADVLRVPNAALRVKPSPEALAAYGAAADVTATATAPGTAEPRRGDRPAPGPRRPGGRTGEVWTFANGRLTKVAVRVGLADAGHTAITSGEISEGAEVVTSITADPAAGTTTSSRSPLLPAGRRPGGAGGPGPARTP